MKLIKKLASQEWRVVERGTVNLLTKYLVYNILIDKSFFLIITNGPAKISETRGSYVLLWNFN